MGNLAQDRQGLEPDPEAHEEPSPADAADEKVPPAQRDEDRAEGGGEREQGEDGLEHEQGRVRDGRRQVLPVDPAEAPDLRRRQLPREEEGGGEDAEGHAVPVLHAAHPPPGLLRRHGAVHRGQDTYGLLPRYQGTNGQRARLSSGGSFEISRCSAWSAAGTVPRSRGCAWIASGSGTRSSTPRTRSMPSCAWTAGGSRPKEVGSASTWRSRSPLFCGSGSPRTSGRAASRSRTSRARRTRRTSASR